MRRLYLILLLVLLVPGSSQSTVDPLNNSYKPSMDTNCAHAQYDARAWMTDTMTKLRQDSGSAASNACTLTIYGTQNEFVDFQVHFHDTGSGTSNLAVTVSNFVQSSPGSYTISASTSVPPSIVVYREAYVHIQGSPSNSQTDSIVSGGANYNTYYSGGPLGYYPDILIPTVDPYWSQTTNAFPFTVAANQNQSAWVDVLIPSGAPSGYYSGTVTVKSGSTTLATMPVTIAVWQWPSAGYMPSTPTLKGSLESWTYTSGLCLAMYSPGNTTGNCSTYPGGDSVDNDSAITHIWLDATLLAKDHRFGMSENQNIYPGSGSFTTWNSLIGVTMMAGENNLHGGAGTTHPILPSSTLNTKNVDAIAMQITAGSESSSTVTLTVSSLSTDCVVGGVMTVRGATPNVNQQYFYNTAYTIAALNSGTNTITAPGPTTGLPAITSGQAYCFKPTFQAWQNNFTSQSYGTAGHLPLFYKLWDEPGDYSQGLENYTSVYTQAAAYHSMLTTGVPLAVTADLWFTLQSQSLANSLSTSVCGNTTCLANSIDIIIPTITSFEYMPAQGRVGGANQTAAMYATWLAATPNNGISRQYWSYLACLTAGTCSNGCPGPYPTYYGCNTGTLTTGQVTTYPNYNVDGKPAANRAMEWLSFLHGATGELYYAGDVCNTIGPSLANSCTPTGVTWDPWNGIYYSGGWGDGTLVYAGGVVSGKINYMGASVTTPLILPSMRLKHIRDGVQDYEYLNALTVAGKSSVVSTQIASWVTNSYTFETSGAGLQAARLNLGTAMHQLTFNGATQGATVQGFFSNGARIQ